MSNPVAIIILIICLILSATFSGAEIAFAKVNKLKIKRDLEENKKGAKTVYDIVNGYSTTLTTILITNNLVNILASSVATILFTNLVGKENGETVATIVMTLLILTFGEVLPKGICASKAYSFTRLLALPIKICSIIFKPFVIIYTALVNLISRLFDKKEEEVSDDELFTMVDTLEEQGIIDEDDQELIENAIDFVDVDAVEIMQPRVDVFGFDINDDINELLKDPNLLNFSRIPVYEESLDNIIGILNSKQLIKLHLNEETYNIRDLLTEPLYVFQTQSISDILLKLRQEHIHMAIVKDEYGGTAGILTMEDILEELVGEILDEKDEEEMEEYHKVNKNKFTVDGFMNLYDFFDLIDYDYEDFESVYSTVGGWITDELEKFAEIGDSFEFHGHLIKVIRAEEFTIDRVSVEKLQKEDDED